jgi:peptidyl-prolyl cis-trans isomerase D
MAALQTIRNKAGLLVSIVIGLALVAFILDPKTLEAFTKGDRENIGEIFGEKIPYVEFMNEVNAFTQQYESQTGQKLNSNMTGMVREQAWNSIIQRKVYDKCFKEVGLSVESDELFDMVYGNNIAPIIRQQFRNRETGVFDKDLLMRNLKAIDQNLEFKNWWINVEKNLEQQRLHSKFMNLISKSNYVTRVDAENGINKLEKQVDFEYVKIPHSSVKAEDIKIESSDLKKYFEENKAKFQKDRESRSISYVEFMIEPSEEDQKNVKVEVDKLFEELKTAKDPMYFAKLNSDDKTADIFLHENELEDNLKSLYSAKVGTTVAPFEGEGKHTFAQLVESKVLSDSVNLKSIYIANLADEKATAKKVDSLINLYKKGKASFDKLIEENSADPNKAQNKAGLWVALRQLPANISDSCYALKTKSTFKIANQQGVTIFKIEKKTKPVKQVKIAKVIRYVDASQKTVKDIYNKASDFVSKNMEYKKYTLENTVPKRTAYSLDKMSASVNNLPNSRNLVRSAFEAEKQGILLDQTGNAIFDYEDRYVIAYLTGASPAGEPSIASVKDELNIEVRAAKKSEKIISELKKASTLNEYATNAGTDVKDAAAVKFSSFYIPEIGLEPNLVADIFKLKENQISKPIKGSSAVYIAKVKAIQKPEVTPEKIKLYKNSVNQRRTSELEVFNSLKENANLVDNRFNFY